MSRVHLVLASILLLGACKSEEEQQDELRDDYLGAVCRIYSEPACIDNMSEHCGFSISFDSQSECLQFMLLFMDPSCDMGASLLAEEDAARSCLSELEGYDCSAEPLCNDDGEFLPEQAGDCATVTQALEADCPTGDTGA